jgi:hypothetical protein
MKQIILTISGFVIALFGVVTFFMSTSVIFGLFDIREKEGNYVMFVVVANFLCAFLYMAAAYGFFAKRKWTTMVLNVAVAVLITTFIAFGIHIYLGGIYEAKTAYAMLFRTIVSIGFLLISLKYISRENFKIKE